MKIYRWTVITLLFLLAVAGVVIATLIGCVDRNPVADENGRVLSQVGISWVIFGFAAFALVASMTVLIMSYVGKGLQVFSWQTGLLAAIIWGISVGMVVAYWESINKPLNEQQNGARLEEAAIWFYFVGGVVIAILAMIAMMRVIGISIQDAGCDPDKIPIITGRFKACDGPEPREVAASTSGGSRARGKYGF